MKAASQLSCENPDIIVVGAGPAGLAAGLAVASTGSRVLCAGQSFRTSTGDTRTTALLQTSVRFLDRLGTWQNCASKATPLEGIRLIDDTGQLIRAPEVEFHYRELGDEPFGFNIPNAELVRALSETADAAPLLATMVTEGAKVADFNDDRISVELAPGKSTAVQLVVAADGRASACRTAAGISTRSWSYDQCAIACNFEHSAAHGNFSNEFHRASGPFTTVPLAGNSSSLVWVERPAEADRLMKLDDEEFCVAIEARLHGVLGSVNNVGRRAAFPLSGLTPSAFARNRVALVGEAAHVLPPIGAQGLNLGFRDAAVLAEIVGDAISAGRDPGSAQTLQRYHRARRSDILTRTAAVDLLNRSLLSPLLPVHALRGMGLQLLKSVGPLRRLAMREGVAPDSALPALMRQ